MQIISHCFVVRIVLSVTVAAVAGELLAQQKMPVPEGAQLEASHKAADELFGTRFRSAKSAPDKTALAAEIIETALNVQDRSADQYVLLTIARDVAAGAGDAVTALQAVEQLVERFDVPAAKIKAVTLLATAPKATVSTQHKAVAEAARSIVGQLAEADHYGLALSVCEAARSSAQKAGEYSLLKEWSAKANELKRWQEESQEYRGALVVIENNPAEPAANLAAGRYLCFVKNDWERGVPYLARGGDVALKAVAIKELRGATSAEEQARVGDAWWALAETKEGSERDTLRLRAGFWYRQAEPKLAPGLAARKIRQRLDKLTKLGREIPRGPRVSRASQAPPLAIAPFDEKTARQYQAAWAKYLKLPVEMTNSIGMRLVLIPPGEFDMGATEAEVAKLLAQAKTTEPPQWYIDRLPSEAPKHRVRITKPFYLGAYEVTRAEYERVAGSNSRKFKGDRTRPVEAVDWHEASAFCRKLGELPQEQAARAAYRLPSEAEWEYACRAGTTTPWYSGNDEATLRDSAWFGANAGGGTHPVGRKTPNPWGLYDMHGNVWEWCQDWWGDRYYATSPTADPTGAAGGSNRVCRGGSVLGVASCCRASCRHGGDPGDRYDGTGFRLARLVSF